MFLKYFPIYLKQTKASLPFSTKTVMPQKTNNLIGAFVQNQNDSNKLAPHFSAFKTEFCGMFMSNYLLKILQHFEQP